MTSLPGSTTTDRNNDGYAPAASVIDTDVDVVPTEGHDGAALLPLMDDEYWAPLPSPLPIATIALIVRLSHVTVLRRLNAGEIPGYFIGGSWIVFKDEFRAWLGGTRNVPLPPPANTDPLASYDDALGVADLMELFGKGKQTILRWLKHQDIPGYLVAGRWVVYKAELRDTLTRTSNQSRG